VVNFVLGVVVGVAAGVIAVAWAAAVQRRREDLFRINLHRRYGSHR
jgi:hypothetical protein